MFDDNLIELNQAIVITYLKDLVMAIRKKDEYKVETLIKQINNDDVHFVIYSDDMKKVLINRAFELAKEGRKEYVKRQRIDY